MEMNKKTLLLVVSINLAVLLLLALFAPHLMISPGKPIQAHAHLTDDCFACHSAFFGSTPEKCIACHKVEEIGLKTTRGIAIAGEKKSVAFHQSLVEEDCVACHSEHRGVQPYRPIGQFTHELLEPDVQERCEGCHANPGDRLHGRIEGRCSACHTRERWTPATFDHSDYFRFDRAHETECATCHVDNNYDSYTCYGCHEHSRSNIRGEHLEEGIRDYEQCTDCHRSGDEDEAEYIWRSRRYGIGGGESGYRREEDHDERRMGRRRHDDD